MTRGGELSTRLAYAFPAVRFMNEEIPPGLWQPVVQLAVKIGWICVENETVAAGAAATVRETAWVAVTAGVAESVTRTVKLEVAAAVGVPLMTPAALRFNPAGRVPDATVHV